ncbi:MAG: hypothetical protein U1D30_13955 [Planctomycetota bacterium]
MGMLPSLCVESYLRELIEQGFEVAVVRDATAAPRFPVIGDGYKVALVNYGFIANAVLSTDGAMSYLRQSLTQLDYSSQVGEWGTWPPETRWVRVCQAVTSRSAIGTV